MDQESMSSLYASKINNYKQSNTIDLYSLLIPAIREIFMYQHPETGTYKCRRAGCFIVGWFVGDFLHSMTQLYLNRRLRLNPIGNEYISKYISFLMRWTKQPDSSDNIRNIFESAPSISTSLVSLHSHPGSASIRNASVEQMVLIAKLLGKEPYLIQQSNSDVRNERNGCKSYHWVKDLSVKDKSFAPPPNSIITISDVDMYLDMPSMISNHVYPYLISTFQPTEVATSTGEYAFMFNKDNEVEYTVSGGAYYKHQVWNYKHDVLIAKSSHFCGLYYRTTSYNINRKQMDKHHQIILLTPINTFISPILDFSCAISGHELRRLDVVHGEFARLDIMSVEGLKRSTGRLGKFTSATILVSHDDAISSIQRASKVDISMAQIRTITNLSDDAAIAILTECHRSEHANKYIDCIYPMDASVQKYQYGPKNYDPEAPSCVTPFMNPIIGGCYAPDKCLNNDKAMIEGRVNNIKCKAFKLDKFMLKCIDDFISLLIPDHLADTFCPLDEQEVHERQTRPSQRAILRQAIDSISVIKDGIKSFMKAETYGDPKDPRVISTVTPETKLNYSRYVYAFSTLLKQQPWYAFGKTPIDIAKRVSEICFKAAHVKKTDFSRFDGRVSNVLRILERLMMLRLFKKTFHKDMLELMQGQKDQRGRTTFGVKYETDDTRASGSAETADFNSTDNAFVAFCAFRSSINPVNGSFYTPKEAYSMLGIYGGDDGLTADINSDIYIKAATAVGQVLEIVEVRRGELGVEFLSRQFSPYVWEGDLDSCCDIPRQLAKLHVTTVLPPNVTPEQKFGERLFAFAFTDRNTPIFEFMIKFVEMRRPDLFPKARTPLSKLIGNYFSQYDMDVQFPNENRGNWMDGYATAIMQGFDWDLFNQWLAAFWAEPTNEILLSPPMCMPELQRLIVKQPVVVNGDIISPPTAPLVRGKANKAYARTKKERPVKKNKGPH